MSDDERRPDDEPAPEAGGQPEDSSADAAAEEAKKAGNRRAIRFLLTFGISYALFQALYHGVILGSSLFTSYLGVTAKAGAGLLRVFGRNVQALGDRVSGEGFAVAVRSGCDGLEPMALLALGVLSFPASWKKKIIGVVGGVGMLLFLNVVRVATLHEVGVRCELETFESAHLTVWPTILIFCAVAGWVGWMVWSQRPAKTADAGDAEAATT
ncbi:MAG: exosortase H [Acidobacteriota bacterium]